MSDTTRNNLPRIPSDDSVPAETLAAKGEQGLEQAPDPKPEGTTKDDK